MTGEEYARVEDPRSEHYNRIGVVVGMPRGNLLRLRFYGGTEAWFKFCDLTTVSATEYWDQVGEGS